MVSDFRREKRFADCSCVLRRFCPVATLFFVRRPDGAAVAEMAFSDAAFSSPRRRGTTATPFLLSLAKRDAGVSACGQSDFLAAEKVTKKPPKPAVLESLFVGRVLSVVWFFEKSITLFS